ncbi:unnamed protein product [Symbiodinium sp. CCMP2592]|nr:unnamed protein product [Symbiodinium sp. CCMP2592]CAE7335381.1 unnamed protein product [Symbiodinium sp. CCMP2592]
MAAVVDAAIQKSTAAEGVPVLGTPSPDEIETQLLETAVATQAQAADHAFCCYRCRKNHPKTEMVVRSANRICCKDCNATMTTLNRNGLNPDQLLEEEELEKFFQTAKDTRSKGERLSYQKTRGILKDCMVLTSTKRYKESESGTFLPLTMYAAKGLSKDELDKIEATCEAKDHPVFGKTYKVNFESQTKEKTVEECETKLCSLETAMKRKKLEGEAPRKALAGAGAAQLALCDLAQEFEGLESDEEAETTTKAAKQNPDKAAKAAAKKAEREKLRQAKKDFKVLVAAVGKLLPNLRSSKTRLENLMEKLGEQALAGLQSCVQEQLQEVLPLLTSYEKDANALLGAAAQGENTWTGPEPLSFQTPLDLQQVVKDAACVAKSLQDLKRQAADAKAAAPKRARKTK